MEFCSLHPLDPHVVEVYVRSVIAVDATGEEPVGGSWDRRVLAAARQGYARACVGEEQGANAVTFGLAHALATAQPTFCFNGVSLTSWEARVDRGIGMMLRPPSRLFVDAGLNVTAARSMPIRLDQGGYMGGAFVPARLMPKLERLFEERMARLLRRLTDAELDAIPVLGLMMEACAYARARDLGLFEAMDVVVPDAPEANPPGALVYAPNRQRMDPTLRRRLEQATKANKPPGLLARLVGGRSNPHRTEDGRRKRP
jgi:hypothetical protein